MQKQTADKPKSRNSYELVYFLTFLSLLIILALLASGTPLSL